MPGRRSSSVAAVRRPSEAPAAIVPPAGEPGNIKKGRRPKAESSATPVQTELMPMLPPSMERTQLAPVEINGPRRHATEKFADHIRGHGIVNPLVVRPNREGIGYDLIGGSKRLWAAELLQLPSVPVTIVDGEYNASALAIADNAQRSENPGRDLAEIEVLVSEGHGYDQIALATGLTKPQIVKRMRLQALTKHWRGQLDTGQLRTSFAEAIAKLPVAAQDRLQKRTAVGGEKLTADLIATERTTLAQQGASDALTGFDDPANDLGAGDRDKRVRELVTAATGFTSLFRSGAHTKSKEGWDRLEAAVVRLEAATATLAPIGNG